MGYPAPAALPPGTLGTAAGWKVCQHLLHRCEGAIPLLTSFSTQYWQKGCDWLRSNHSPSRSDLKPLLQTACRTHSLCSSIQSGPQLR